MSIIGPAFWSQDRVEAINLWKMDPDLDGSLFVHLCVPHFVSLTFWLRYKVFFPLLVPHYFD